MLATLESEKQKYKRRSKEEGRVPAWELLEIVAGYLGGWVHKTEAGDVHILHLLLIIIGMTLITLSEHH